MKVIIDVIRLVFGLAVIDSVQRPLMWISLTAVAASSFIYNNGFMFCISVILIADRIIESHRKHNDLLKIEELEDRILKLEEK